MWVGCCFYGIDDFEEHGEFAVIAPRGGILCHFLSGKGGYYYYFVLTNLTFPLLLSYNHIYRVAKLVRARGMEPTASASTRVQPMMIIGTSKAP